MPTAAVPFCPVAGCPERSHGPCRTHRAQRHQMTDARRGSRHARGYDQQWVRFVLVFRRMLMDRHLLPICGARLSGTPSPHSQCAQRGRVTLEALHCDHEPPLEDWERQDPRRVCDPERVQLLCARCHSAKTRAERMR